MGVCYCNCPCIKKSKIPYEDFVREIISSLKICSNSFMILNARLSKLTSNLDKFYKKSIEKDLIFIFYEENTKINEHYDYHAKIFKMFYDNLDHETSVYQILFYLFPLLKKVKLPSEQFI